MPAIHRGFDARTPYAVLDREHQALRHGLAQLRTALRPDQSTSAPALRQQIVMVRRSLAAHFAFEEEFGSLHYLVATRPSLQPRLEQLHRDHRDILVEMDMLLAGLERGVSLTEVGATLSVLLDRLADHVLGQHLLVRRALLGDEHPLPAHAAGSSVSGAVEPERSRRAS